MHPPSRIGLLLRNILQHFEGWEAEAVTFGGQVLVRKNIRARHENKVMQGVKFVSRRLTVGKTEE